MIANLTEKRRAALRNAARICREVTAFDEAKIIEDMLAENSAIRSTVVPAFLTMDDIVVVPYHPDAYWEEYQQDQTFEKMTRWLKHRAWYLWMEEEARRIICSKDMHMAMLPTAKRELLDDCLKEQRRIIQGADRRCP